jgi:hypothetical protein
LLRSRLLTVGSDSPCHLDGKHVLERGGERREIQTGKKKSLISPSHILSQLQALSNNTNTEYLSWKKPYF